MNFLIQGQKCKFVTFVKIRDASKTSNALASLSKEAIQNAFDNVPFGDLIYGLLVSVPAVELHVGGTGILNYIFDT